MLLVKGLIRDKKVFTIGNVKESPWIKIEYAKPLGIASMMATPIVSMGEALGLIFVKYGEPRAFTQRELSILHGISQQVSVAVANAGMYQTITNKSMELAHPVDSLEKVW
jgi:GAF domain-containing protein